MKIILVLIGIMLIAFGAFLIFDSFFVHAITLNYGTYSIGFLDPIIDHWMIGVLFTVSGAYLMREADVI